MSESEYPPQPWRLRNREWRLDNFYTIKNKDGVVVPFSRLPVQMMFWRNMWYRNVVPKARKHGLSTMIEILMLDAAMFSTNTTCGIVDYTIKDARLKLANIRWIYEQLPAEIRAEHPLVNDAKEELTFANGSGIWVGTSHRGGTPQILHISEFGRIAAENPAHAKEIITGGIGAVGVGQFVHVESTAKGRGGEFHDMVTLAEEVKKSGRGLSPIDFKLHFYPWMLHPDYRIQVASSPVTQELTEYFDKVQAETKINIDLFQRQWYATTLRQFGPDDMLSEYPSTLEECFASSLEGAYFRREMSKARTDKRIGFPFPHDETRRVNTFWDIGMDSYTAIWFHQTDGLRHWLIDYYENSGESLPHYVNILKQKAEARGFTYGRHYGPHDLAVKDWSASMAKPRVEIAKDLGVEFTVVPRVQHKEDAIEAARRFLHMAWFDAVHTERGVACLDAYSKAWNETLAVWRSEPKGDWASHGADALMCGVMGLDPERTPDEARRPRGFSKQPRTSQWAG